MSEIKFTDEELQSLQNLSNGYQTITNSMGQLRVQRLLLSQQMDNLEEAELKLESDYLEQQKNEQDLVASLTEKYGPGTLNPKTGVYTPTETQEKVEDSEEK